jgi:hypothetical protein
LNVFRLSSWLYWNHLFCRKVSMSHFSFCMFIFVLCVPYCHLYCYTMTIFLKCLLIFTTMKQCTYNTKVRRRTFPNKETTRVQNTNTPTAIYIATLWLYLITYCILKLRSVNHEAVHKTNRSYHSFMTEQYPSITVCLSHIFVCGNWSC